MKKNARYLLLLLTILSFFSCVINRLNDEKTVITLERNEKDNPMLISLTKGSQWSHKFTPGPFVIYIYPQVVFWIENNEGKLMETLYITGANGKYLKHATKRKLDDEFFQLCFPIWADKVIKANNKLPTAEEPYPDAITSATPQSSFDLDIKLGEIPDTFTIYAEINKSRDYNELYTEEKSDWIGQPSLVYAVEINEIVKEQKYYLKPIVRSGIASDIPGFHEDFEGIDTALELVSEISVVFK